MADSSNSQDVNKMKVADLKKELKNRGLNTSGNKTELIERLAAALETDDSKLDVNGSDELSDDVLNEDEDLDDEIEGDEELAEKALELDASLIGSSDEPEIPTLKRKISIESEPSVPPKKIVLNRALSATVNPVKENTKSEEKIENQSDEKEEEKSGSTIPEEKRVIKLSNLSAKERLEMRAKKFGAPLNEDLKKVARSARFGTETSDNKKNNSISPSAPAKLDVLKKRAERFGISVSSVMSNLDTKERLERRKARFGSTTPATIKSTTVK